MTQAGRTITSKNFDAFKKLMEEVHQKTHGKSITPVSEKAADDIAQKIEDEVGKSITGKTLRTFTNAVLENDYERINPKLYTLHCLAEYVMNGNGIAVKKSENYPYWYDYEKKFFDTKKSEPAPVFSFPSITRKNLAQACMIGGFVAGFVNSLLVILLPKMLSGYFHYADDLLFQMIPLISIANVGCATLLGWFCGYLAWINPNSVKGDAVSLKEKFGIAMLTLVLIVFFKQLASRPRLEDGYMFGRIDFETVAYFLAAVIGIIILISKLRSIEFYSIARIAKHTSLIVIKSMIPIGIIYFIFKFFVEHKSLDKVMFPSKNFTLLYFQYSHPERILLVLFISFSSVFCVLAAKNFALYKRIE